MTVGAPGTGRRAGTAPGRGGKRAQRVARNAVDVSSLLLLHGPQVPLVLALFLIAQALLAFVGAGATPLSPASALGFLSCMMAAFWVVQPASDPLPAWWCAGVLALCAVTVAVQSLQPIPAGIPFSATWHLGAVTMVFFMLIIRGRLASGWLGYVGLALATLLWTTFAGLGPLIGFELVIRHAATLLVSTTIYVGLLSTARSIAAVNRRSLAEAAAAASVDAAASERAAQLERLDEMARPMMSLVAGGSQLSATQKRDCLLIEASLRDLVRGRALAVPPVLAAARAARERGVDVVLLDDSGASGATVAQERVAAILERELNGIETGALTARLQPRGRSSAASIMIAPDGAAPRMLIIDLDGTLA